MNRSRHIPHRRRNVLFRAAHGLALAALFTACGDDGGPDGDTLIGTFNLVEVNGEPLPVIVYAEEREEGYAEIEVRSGYLALNGGSYTGELRVQVYLNGTPAPIVSSLSDTGTYDVSGSQITIASNNEAFGEMTATIDNDRLTATMSHAEYGTFTVTYERR